GQTLAIGTNEGAIQFWDLAAGTQSSAIAAHQGRVRAVAYSRDGKLLASVGEDGKAKIWLTSSGAPQAEIDRQFPAQLVEMQPLVFSSDGSRLFIGYDPYDGAGLFAAD